MTHEFLERFLAIFFPPRCIFCGEVVHYEDEACGACTYPVCSADEIAGQLSGCGIAGALVHAVYEGAVKDAILRLKRTPEKRVPRFFAEAIAAQIGTSWPKIVFDLLVPVPASRQRLSERGYNQARLLAEQIGARIGCAQVVDALVREDSSLAQHTLAKKERLQNALQAYKIALPQAVLGKTVLLVDDVITTGATAQACANCLLAAGAGAVYFVAAAYTRRQGVSGQGTGETGSRECKTS